MTSESAAASCSPKAPSTIPLVQPQWKRLTSRSDAPPSPFGEESESAGEACSVCYKNQGRYTCPRCEIPYCSVACYQQHGSAGNTSSSSCTEGFYQDRVSAIQSLEAKEKVKSMQKILNRSHQHDTTSRSEEELSDEGLWALADALDSGSTLEDSDLDRMLSPNLRSAFMKAIHSGELSTVVERWHPWWTPELGPQSQETIAVQGKLSSTLDERLLKIPPFPTLRPGATYSSLTPSLKYNMVDLLYNVALTLRLYHGVNNAVASCSEAAQTLLSASAVLAQDARYSSVSDALVACTEASTLALRNQDGCNAHWTGLARDASILCQARRHTAHALLDATDIIKAAVRAAKKDGSNRNLTSKLWRSKKKLEFYLSWSRETDLLVDVATEIRDWIEEWRYPDQDDEQGSLWMPRPISTTGSGSGSCSDVTRVNLAPTNGNRTKMVADAPLIAEVTSTCRNRQPCK